MHGSPPRGTVRVFPPGGIAPVRRVGRLMVPPHGINHPGGSMGCFPGGNVGLRG